MNTHMKIALDFEGVCADTNGATVRASDKLTDVHNEEWSFPDQLTEHFMELSQEICETDILSVEPCEPDLGSNVERLMCSGHQVDILTNRPGCDTQIKEWLAEHNVPYEGFTSNPTGTDKSTYRYDAYIDDKPHLAYTVDTLYLYDQPWNHSVDADGVQVKRITSTAEVIEDLASREVPV